MPEIVSRKEAMAVGLRRYFDGKPCRHGHTDERRTSNGSCVPCWRTRNKAWKRTAAGKVSNAAQQRKPRVAAHRNELRKRQRAALRALIEIGVEV